MIAGFRVKAASASTFIPAANATAVRDDGGSTLAVAAKTGNTSSRAATQRIQNLLARAGNGGFAVVITSVFIVHAPGARRVIPVAHATLVFFERGGEAESVRLERSRWGKACLPETSAGSSGELEGFALGVSAASRLARVHAAVLTGVPILRRAV